MISTSERRYRALDRLCGYLERHWSQDRDITRPATDVALDLLSRLYLMREIALAELRYDSR